MSTRSPSCRSGPGALPALSSRPSSEVLAARVRARIRLPGAGVRRRAVRHAPGIVARAGSRCAWLLPAVAAALLVRWIAAAWPLGARELSAARAAAAAITLLALLRGWDRLRRAPPHRKTVVAACATGALLAFACFYNLGRPQFWHNGKQRPMFVHDDDMRIYQPFAKYFDELRYDGIYLASALAVRRGRARRIDRIDRRDADPRPARLSPPPDRASSATTCRRSSSASRPRAGRSSSATSPSSAPSMGPGFINSLDDHGANAPPSWVWLARLAIGHVPATETTLTIAGPDRRGAVAGDGVGDLGVLRSAPDAGRDDGLRRDGPLQVRDQLGRRDAAARLAGAARVRRVRAAQGALALAGALLGAGTMLRVVPAVGLFGVVAPAAAWLVGAVAQAPPDRACARC